VSRFRDVVEGLSKLRVRLDVIVTSPLVRARQTADILAAGLQDAAPIVEAHWLAPGTSIAVAIESLAGYDPAASVALVGHEPGIGELAARLIGSGTPLVFRKGGLCRIDFQSLAAAGSGHLRWFVPPKMLRRVR
jgi:phosphohistidine phosphatase